MSSDRIEQLELVFKPNTLIEINQTEIALLADWIEDILKNIDADKESQVIGHRMN